MTLTILDNNNNIIYEYKLLKNLEISVIDLLTITYYYPRKMLEIKSDFVIKNIKLDNVPLDIQLTIIYLIYNFFDDFELHNLKYSRVDEMLDILKTRGGHNYYTIDDMLIPYWEMWLIKHSKKFSRRYKVEHNHQTYYESINYVLFKILRNIADDEAIIMTYLLLN